MKKLILVIIVGAGLWWYFIGGRTLSEDSVNGFYRNLQMATLERKPEEICSLLADEFKSTGTVTMMGQSRTDVADKATTCESYRELYSTFDKLGEKMGGVLQLDSNYTIHSIQLSKDRKSATVDYNSTLDVAGSIMNIRARSTDRLVRRNGKVLLLGTEGKGSVSSGK